MKKLFSFLFAVMVIASAVVAAPKEQHIYVFAATEAANQPQDSQQRGWAQVLPTYFGEFVKVHNLSQEDKSTQLMISESIWELSKSQITKGAFVVLQYADYDLKQDNQYAHTSIEQFQSNLEKFVKDVKKKKGKPIICTPIARLHYSLETNQLVERHGAYAEAARRVAKANKVPLIDLNNRTLIWLSALSKEEAEQFFIPQDTDIEGKEFRLNEQGALKVAEFFRDEVEAQKIKKLVPYIIHNPSETKYADK